MKAFYALLDALAEAPQDQRLLIEQQIHKTFLRKKAVLALDMSGFTLSVRRDGILPYLCQVRRMQRLTMPIVADFHGELVKYSADNLLAIFDEPNQAVQAGMTMMAAIAHEPPGDGPPLYFSIGVDYGELLLIEGVDCFGDPVNLAYKLGEDIARPSELLITPRVREALRETLRLSLREIQFSVCGVEMLTYSVSAANPEG